MKLKKIAYILSVIAILGNSVPVYAAEAGMKTESTEENKEDNAPEDNAGEPEDGVTASPLEASEITSEDSSSIGIPSISSFEQLPSEVMEVSYDNKPALDELTASFPQTLSVYLNEAAEVTDIPVTWECNDDYTNTDFDTYGFNPAWDEALYPLSSSANTADVPYITVNIHAAKASVFLMNLEKAQSELASLLQSRDILALVYLCDTYAVKQEPGKNTAHIVSVASGQSVQITGIGEDSQKNIWYKVSFDLQGTSYSGYVERDYLAFSDENLISFEQKYVSSYLYRTASHASRSVDEKGAYADISQFPDSYQGALTSLKKAHPNWVFVKMDTGLDWSSAVSNENSNSRSLIHSSVNSAWKEKSYDASWAYPTNGILAYYMDPRNFLTDNHVFQFELLSYNATYHTETAVQGILDSTFMSGIIPSDSRTYAQTFCSIGSTLNVSPFHLASRVRQEQGDGKSPLISGTYSGYEGVYNYFNIGATGRGNKEVIENGLSYAKSEGWTSRYISLQGGSNVISKNYIQKYQDTLYLQKYNVDKNSPYKIYNHQYMQNIAAPSSEAVNVRKAYAAAGSIDKPFVFRIPVYENMPYTPCAQPSKVKEVTLSKTGLTLKADESATLTPYVDGSMISVSSVSFKSDNLKVATVDANGKVTGISSGTANITCSMSGASTATCVVTVEKLTPVYTLPVLGNVTYSPSQKLSSIPLPVGWTWDNPDAVPTVTNSGYPATYTPSDTAKYTTAKETLPLTVAKGTPSYIPPTGLQTTAGNALASIKLPAGFFWEKPETILDKEGTASCSVSYNPDPANYHTVTGISLSVKVGAGSTDCTAGHTFSAWQSAAAATCTAAGKSTRACSLCGYEETQATPALGHSYTSSVTKEPTEAENGIRTYTCSACKDSYTETIDKLPASHTHSYTTRITKEASCTEKGVKTYTCSCGSSYTEDIPSLGHDMSDGKCKRCGYKEAASGSPENSSSGNSSSGSSSSGSSSSGSSSSSSNSSGSNSSGSSANTAPVNSIEPTSTAPPAATNSSGTANSSDTGTAGSANGAATTKNPEKQEAASENVTIDMSQKDQNTVLYEEALSAIRGQDIDVVLSMGNSISWTINGRNIVADEANGIDMGVKVNTGNIPSEILSLAAGANENNTILEISLHHDGPFDFSPILTVNTAIDNAGRTGNLFYYNPDSKALEFVDSAKISETGDISFTFSHASDYAIIISDESMQEIGVISETVKNEQEEAVPVTADIVAGDADEKAKTPLSPVTILIIVVIIIICIGIGLTVYFLLGRKEDDGLYEDEKETGEEQEEYIDDLSGNAKVKVHAQSPVDEYDENGTDDFIDDYREPELKTKKTGKVISISKKLPASYENDEFDGFE